MRKIRYDEASGKMSRHIDDRKVYICIPEDSEFDYNTSYVRKIEDDRQSVIYRTKSKKRAMVKSLSDSIKLLAYIQRYYGYNKAFIEDLEGNVIKVEIRHSIGRYVKSGDISP
ncbi:MAG: hypothetical protein WC781_01685 [Candidatus Pacearchaeota archaeon]|jgi:hypothetical protein